MACCVQGDGSLRPLDAELVRANLGSGIVVGVLEDVVGTQEIVRHFLPWVRVPEQLPRVNDGRVGRGDTAATIARLSQAQLEVLIDLTRAERAVYNHALRLHASQLEAARRAGATTGNGATSATTRSSLSHGGTNHYDSAPTDSGSLPSDSESEGLSLGHYAEA